MGWSRFRRGWITRTPCLVGGVRGLPSSLGAGLRTINARTKQGCAGCDTDGHGNIVLAQDCLGSCLSANLERFAWGLCFSANLNRFAWGFVFEREPRERCLGADRHAAADPRVRSERDRKSLQMPEREATLAGRRPSTHDAFQASSAMTMVTGPCHSPAPALAGPFHSPAVSPCASNLAANARMNAATASSTAAASSSVYLSAGIRPGSRHVRRTRASAPSRSS